MKRSKTKWQWREGSVDPTTEHLEIRYGDAAKSAYSEWQPIALIGKPKNHVFTVHWLLDRRNADHDRVVQKTCKELDFYLVEKRIIDPWEYAKYYCTTGANMYSNVHWSYFRHGRDGKRLSSIVVKLSTEEAKRFLGKRKNPGT